MSDPVVVRPERSSDPAAIRAVHLAAFATAEEADLVDALRAAHAVLLSLVAEIDGAVVGHILFSPVQIERPGSARVAAGLAPMAVAPPYQRTGIGGRLVTAGLDALRGAGESGVVVLGHPTYYPRLGFRPAAELGLRWQGGHDEAFFAMELTPGAFAGGGVVAYRPELGSY